MLRILSRKSSNSNSPKSSDDSLTKLIALGTMFAIGAQAYASFGQADALKNQAQALGNQNTTMESRDKNQRCDVLRNKLQRVEEEFTDLIYGSPHRESSDGIATIRGIAVKDTNETNDDTLKWYSEELTKFQTHVDVWKKNCKVFSAHPNFKNPSEYKANKIRSHCKDYWNRILKKKELHTNICDQLTRLVPEENMAPLLSLIETNTLFERYSRFTRWVILFDSTMNVDIKNELLYQPKKVGQALEFDKKQVVDLNEVLNLVKYEKLMK